MEPLTQMSQYLAEHQVKVVHVERLHGLYSEFEPKDLPQPKKGTAAMKPKIAKPKTVQEREAAILRTNSAFDCTGKPSRPTSRQVGLNLDDPDTLQALAATGWRRVV